MISNRVIAASRVNGIRLTLKSGAVVFGSSALVLLAFPEFFLELLALDSTSAPLVWSMRMIGVTLVALAGNMWANSTNSNNHSVMRVGAVMAISAAGLGVLTLLLPVPLTWLSVAYAIVGFAFSLSYVFFLVQSRRWVYGPPMSADKPTRPPRGRKRMLKHDRSQVWHGVRRRSRLRIGLAITGASAVVALAATLGFAAYLANTFDVNTTTLEGVIETATPTPGATAVDSTKPENILILGSDTRGKLKSDPNAEGYRSDVVMLVHLDGDRKNVQILSIPRDTWVDIPCYGKGKINWAMSYGGVTCAVSTVERFLGITIDHFVLVNFSGVKNLTEVLDGVTVDNPRAFTSDVNDYEFNRYFYEKGPIELRGARALAFVRERHAFADGDVSRVKNQQLFVNAVVDKLLTFGVLTNPGKMANVAGAIGEVLVVDPGLDSNWVIRTAVQVSPFDRSRLNMFVMPIERTALIGTQYAVIPDAEEMTFISGLLSRDALAGYVPPPQPAVDALD